MITTTLRSQLVIALTGLERSLKAASSTREKRQRRRHGVDRLERTVTAVGGIDRLGGGSDDRRSLKREQREI
ncbi:hypothetical protein Q3G72_009650 [Acer saccharum]|nr:hypothetical protein Q3G72_009650 [Acer saccharum]